MRDLRLLGVHEDGEHLLLSDEDGERYRVAVDESLRAAVRREPPHLARLQVDRDHSLRPRDVQALIRAGASAEEVAQRAGWPVEKVRRYEGPILAEREYVASLARDSRMRGRSGSASAAGGASALAARVAERLADRGVDAGLVTWDAWRAEEGPWTVVVTFAAGGRQRSASWHFDTVDRVVSPVDDEARWLGEDEPRASGPLPPAPRPAPDAPSRRVYDVEAEGGVRDEGPPAGPVDLMTAMRQRSGARGRRSATPVPGRGLRDAPPPPELLAGDLDEELPLENLPVLGAEAHEPVVGQVLETISPQPATVEPGAETEHVEPASADGEVTADDAPTEENGAAARAETADPDAPAAEAALPARVAPDDAAVAPSAAPVEAPPVEPSKDARRRPGRRSGRPSVPSWDDIMFGTRQSAGGDAGDKP